MEAAAVPLKKEPGMLVQMPHAKRKKTGKPARDSVATAPSGPTILQEDGSCLICSQEICECPWEIKKMFLNGNHPADAYDDIAGEKVCWVRVLKRDGKYMLGCRQCMTHLGKGGCKPAGGNCKIHNGQMVITDHVGPDTLTGHKGYGAKRQSLK